MRSKLEADIAEVMRRHSKVGSFIIVVPDDSGEGVLASAADAGSPSDLSTLFHAASEVFLGAFARISGLPHYAARRAMEGLMEGAEHAYVARLEDAQEQHASTLAEES